MDDQDKAARMLDEKLHELLVGIGKEPVSEETRQLALQLQQLLNDRQAMATAKG
ncbi:MULTISPECIES: hypothetical protein [unclassified Yoonia]|uniref:hypothetical protein n=1 Tax=unclassified Yoonia TaxID=2629118 RepID=UPI002AFFD890|nr:MULTISPECIES: hypothetical protein [unclassified Yoonia]